MSEQSTTPVTPSSGSSRMEAEPLLEVLSGDTVDLGHVLVSNKHEFSYCEVLNKTDVPVRLDLTSTVPTLGFQHSNENFRDTTENPVQKHNFNQVFNYVNLIKAVEIPPQKPVCVVISYRPTEQPRKPHQGPLEALEYQDVGEILLQARTEDGRTQKTKLKFICRCCIPILEVSATELDFGLITSVPNEANTQIQELTISNNSVIPLDIVLRVSRGSGGLVCIVHDYDQNENLVDKEITVGAHDFKRIQVSVVAKPDTSGDHDMQLRIENRSDQTTHTVLICGTIAHSTSPSKPFTDISLPSGENFVDFGNCYAGEETSQIMTVTNLSIHPVLIQFDHDSNDTRDRVKGKLGVRVHDEQHHLKEQHRDELCEVFLKPGMSEKLAVCYTPDLTHDKRKITGRRPGDKLQPVRFRLFVRSSVLKDGEQVPAEGVKKNSKGISCRAKVCTSRVEVKEKEIDFGDSLVGATASCQVTIENPTQMPAEMRIEYDSKIMKAVSGNEVVIKESSAISLEFQIVPHKVNPSFCKQVYLRNIHNPKDLSIINLSSNNIDSMTSTHAQYYSLTLLNKKRDKEEGSSRQTELTVEVTPGFPTLRAFRLKNKQDQELVLSLGTSRPQSMGVYVASDSLSKSRLLREFDNDGYLKTFPEREPKEERAYVANVLKLKQRLDEALSTKELMPIEDVTLAPEGQPESEAICYVLVRMSGKRSTREESIKISVKNLPGAGEREIPIVLQIHETGLDIGQRNLNLGQVIVGERNSCMIFLSNASRQPLLFEVVKDSSSLHSTQLRIEGTKDQKYVGLVRPFANRPLELQFHPSMRGKFNERLTFSNLLDPATQKILILKANVSKTATFEVKPMAIDAGTVLLGDTGMHASYFRCKDTVRTKFTLINIGKSKREYVISPSSATPLNLEDIQMTVDFDVETVKAQASSRNLEEEIEALEQKIKGHMRKKNEDKVARAEKKLARLKEMLVSGGTNDDTSDDGGSVSSSDDDNKKDRALVDSSGKGRFVTRPVPHGGTISVGVTIYIKKLTHEKLNKVVNLDFSISEARDKEAHSTVKTTFRIVDNLEAYMKSNTNGYRPTEDCDPMEREDRRAPRNKEHPPKEIGELSVNTEEIDFGKLNIGTSASKVITLSAHNGQAGYVILQNKRVGGSGSKDAKVEIEPKNGVVTPSQPVKVTISVTPMCGKLQKYLLDIRNLFDKSVTTVMLNVCGIEVAPIATSPACLDFETVYLATKQPVDRFGSKEQAKKFLRVSIHNELDTDFDVKLSSTHAAQCGIYKDLSKAEPGQEIKTLHLTKKSTTPIYIAMYPRLEREKAARGICRRLKGAVMISSETGSWRKDIPFTCTVGCVPLKVHGSPIVDLGTCKKDKRNKYLPIKGVFMLQNMNQELALEYSLSTNDAILRVDNFEGFIEPNGVVEVGYTLMPHGSGLIQESITFKNRSSSQVQIKRTLLLFVDDQCIKTSLLSRSGSLVLPLPVRTVTLSEKAISGVETNYVFVNNLAQKRVEFKMENKSGTELWMLPKCDLHGYDSQGNYLPCLTACIKTEDFEANRLVPAASPPNINARRSVLWSSAGPCIVLPKDRSTTVLLEARCVPCYSNLSSSDKKKLRENKRVTISCNLCFFVEKAISHSRISSGTPFSHGRAAQLVKVLIEICSSDIEFGTPHSLELGKISKLEKFPFNVEVRNTSQVETDMMLVLPPNMYIEPCQTPFQCGFPVESVDPMRLPGLAKPIPFSHSGHTASVKRCSGSSPSAFVPALTPPGAHMTRCCSLLATSTEILGDTEGPWQYPIPAESEVTLHCVFCPPFIEHDERGRISTEIVLKNAYTEANVHRLPVTAVVQRSVWVFEGPDVGAEGENDGPLRLNSLIRVAPSGSGNDTGRADAKLVLRCNEPPATEDETVNATVVLETKTDVEGFLSLKLLLLATNVSLPSRPALAFTRDEPTVGLRVRCTPITGQCITKTLAEHMWRFLLEDLQQAEHTQEKEVHVQNESTDWDTSALIDHNISPYEVVTYSMTLRLRDRSVEARQIHLGDLIVESAGYPSSRKEIWGYIHQAPTYEIACHKKLFLYETNRTDSEKMFKGSFKVANLEAQSGRDLHLLTKPVMRDGYSIHVEVPSVTVAGIEPVTINIKVQVPLMMQDDHLHDSVLLFFQDLNCPISVQAITICFMKPTTENDDEHALVQEMLPTCDSSEVPDVSQTADVAQVSDKTKRDRADSPCIQGDDKASAESVVSPGKDRRLEDLEPPSESDLQDYISKISLNDAPVLKLLNCKALDPTDTCRQYSLALTPGKLDGDPPSTMVHIENMLSRTIDVEVNIIKLPNETGWLRANKSKLKINAHDKQPLILSAATQNVGSFSTYVLLEVPDVFGESISLKCTGDVQAWGSTAASCFDILVDGRTTTPVRPHTYEMELGDLFYDEQMMHRCVDIVNSSSTRLEFNVSHTTQQVPDVDVQLEMSLTLHSLRPFQRLSVEPHQTTRVYIWYLASSRKGAENRLPAVELTTEITLKCRMVKDLTKTIVVKAWCHEPQVSVSAHELNVACSDDPSAALLMLSNKWVVPAAVEVRRFALSVFSLGAAMPINTPFVLGPKETLTLTVSLDVSKIEGLKKQHQRSNFVVEEHFAVYNKGIPKEKKFITLHAFAGMSVQSFLPKDVLPAMTTFNRLRDKIFLMVRQFKVFAALEERVLALEENEDDSDGSSDDGCEKGKSCANAVHNELSRFEQSLGAVEGLYLEFRWLTDELVYHGLQGKKSYFDLAKLFFHGILSNWMFHHAVLKLSPQLQAWVGQAVYFDTFSSLFGAGIGDITPPQKPIASDRRHSTKKREG
eukprot:TRINITY_DN1462_c4_g1_i1.p1 TRINITY_DN1462_c4_g1~~TRINITY_DN1462_c4_g1_i1.p1  ORF type:complete len:2816 (+),score=603.35 TRINITY_DN1462_c4_g1_i1:88-8535(+)